MTQLSDLFLSGFFKPISSFKFILTLPQKLDESVATWHSKKSQLWLESKNNFDFKGGFCIDLKKTISLRINEEDSIGTDRSIRDMCHN